MKKIDLVHTDRNIHWHPFTQMAEYAADDPLLIERGEGCWLIDNEGRRYLDGVSSIWCNVHGHNKKEINDAIISQLKCIAHSTALGSGNTTTSEFSARLIDVAPKGLTRVFFSEDGAEAMEIAIKMAFQFWINKGHPERNRFLTLGDAYHGDTIGAVSVGAISLFHGIFKPLLFESIVVPPPRDLSWRQDGKSNAEKCAEEEQAISVVLEAIEQNKDMLAAVVLESGLQGACGIHPMPQGFLSSVREATQRYGILLILDEVATGFGRTGRMFACEHEGVCPDLMALGKGITGGYLPLAATMATDRIFKAFEGEFAEMKHFFHGHTYTGNPLACAAAIASLNLFNSENVLARIKPHIARIDAVREEFLAHPNVGDFRQWGLMAGIELVRAKPSLEAFPIEMKSAYRVCALARKMGVYLRPLGNVIVWMPPLAISSDELDLLISATREAINEFAREL